MPAEFVIANNTARAFEVAAGDLLSVGGTSIADFVLVNRDNPRERFDQARTKVTCDRIFISTGDWLMSRGNRRMAQIVADGFTAGHHDLQFGMCSGRRYQMVAADTAGDPALRYRRPVRLADLPDHGCWENLQGVLAPFGIAPEDIPNPLNLFQDVRIDGATGRMELTVIRPQPGSATVFRLAMDCLCAISACPDLHVGGGPIHVRIGDGPPLR